MVAKSIVLHVNSYQIIESWRWEAQNTGDLLGMEKVCGLVPVDPHTSQIIAQKIVKRISGKERQAVWNPIGLVCGIVEVRLCSSSKVANGLGTLLICSRPDSESDAVKGV